MTVEVDMLGMPVLPTIKEENRLFKKGFKFIAGVDEAGRGALAGPVVAAAVVWDGRINDKDREYFFNSVRDSKLLSEKKREELYLRIRDFFPYRAAAVSEKIIDGTNILKASLEAMRKAVCGLRRLPDFILIDGRFILEDLQVNQKAVIRGDQQIFLVAAASIVAKVTRDRIMKKMNESYPGYGFARHKGYGTKEHFAAIKKHGPCPIHRMSFRPMTLRQ